MRMRPHRRPMYRNLPAPPMWTFVQAMRTEHPLLRAPWGGLETEVSFDPAGAACSGVGAEDRCKLATDQSTILAIQVVVVPARHEFEADVQICSSRKRGFGPAFAGAQAPRRSKLDEDPAKRQAMRVLREQRG
jgi:hypothetical protein